MKGVGTLIKIGIHTLMEHEQDEHNPKKLPHREQISKHKNYRVVNVLYL